MILRVVEPTAADRWFTAVLWMVGVAGAIGVCGLITFFIARFWSDEPESWASGIMVALGIISLLAYLTTVIE